jgi:CheY-like chemotaxis protein
VDRSPPGPAGRTTVLVVDDDDDIRGLVRVVLERGGHAVVGAADGEEALDAVARARPDLVLLDVNMPGIDGVEVTRRLRASPATRTLPVVLMTADVAARERGLAAGADDYLTKPFLPAVLLARVAAHLGAR